MSSDTTSEFIADKIRSNILDGTLMPGSRVTIASLAERYGVSHLPVREALRMSEGDRLLDILPHRGAVIRLPDRKMIENMYAYRAALDGMMAAQCATLVTHEQVKQLRRLATLHRDVRPGNITKSFVANREFHAAIYRIGGNLEALWLVQKGWELIHAVRNNLGGPITRRDDVAEEHFGIVRALEDRNPELARALATAHCELAKRDLLKKMLR